LRSRQELACNYELKKYCGLRFSAIAVSKSIPQDRVEWRQIGFDVIRFLASLKLYALQQPPEQIRTGDYSPVFLGP